MINYNYIIIFAKEMSSAKVFLFIEDTGRSTSLINRVAGLNHISVVLFFTTFEP
jgi:hypothetical protein